MKVSWQLDGVKKSSTVKVVVSVFALSPLLGLLGEVVEESGHLDDLVASRAKAGVGL